MYPVFIPIGSVEKEPPIECPKCGHEFYLDDESELCVDVSGWIFGFLVLAMFAAFGCEIAGFIRVSSDEAEMALGIWILSIVAIVPIGVAIHYFVCKRKGSQQ